MKTLLHLVMMFLPFAPSCLAQDKDTTIDLTGQLYGSIPYGKACQALSYRFSIAYGQNGSQTAQPRDDYFRTQGSGSQCYLEYIGSSPNATLMFESDGITTDGFRKDPQDNHWYSNVKVNKTSTATVSWQVRTIIASNNCGRRSFTTTYAGTYSKIISIPTPPKPTLTALKPVVKAGESTTVLCSECPNTLANETDPFYTYYRSAYQSWSVQCGADGQPLFAGRQTTGDPSARQLTFSADNPYIYKPGTVFRARCEDNGCIGEVSDPVAIGIRYTDLTCNATDENFYIDNVRRTSNRSYHHYTVESFVCDKKSGNPNCTKDKVFNMMKQNKRFAAVVASDFAGLNSKIPLAGSNLIYKLDDTPVKNCETVNLPSYSGMGLNLAALSIVPSSYLITREATTLNPITNPIFQYIDEQAYTITNYTMLGHVLHPGKITRIVVEECDRIKIVTIGSGEHYFGDNWFGEFMAQRNINTGKDLFYNVDQRLIQEFNKLPK